MATDTKILSLGAGVQSTTVALLAVHGEIEPPAHAIFADTGWEPKAVYDHLEWLKPVMEDAGIPVHIVSHGNIREDALSAENKFQTMPVFSSREHGGRGMGARQCTWKYKIDPVTKKQRELIGLKFRQRWTPEHGYVRNMMGISVDEIQRAKDNRVKWIINEFPLLDLRMKRTDCLKWLADHSYSAPRSACIGCPYRDNASWRDIQKNPVEWKDAVAFDKAIRNMHTDGDQQFLHSSLKPLDEVDLRSEEDKGQLTLFDNECEGMCGL